MRFHCVSSSAFRIATRSAACAAFREMALSDRRWLVPFHRALMVAARRHVGEGAPPEIGIAQDDHALDDVLELADIAGKVVADEPLHGLGRQRESLPPKEPRVALDEVVSQWRDFLRTLP